MTAALDFATLPPEINSARMYSGAGSAPTAGRSVSLARLVRRTARQRTVIQLGAFDADR